MPRFDAFLAWLRLRSSDLDTWLSREPLPPLHFTEITDVASPPPEDVVAPGVFYRVLRDDKPKWALFHCPCGCRSVITLSLQCAHRPHWIVRSNKNGRPCLRPSVWRDIGCLSHFIVEDGRIYWCGETGSSPWGPPSNP